MTVFAHTLKRIFKNKIQLLLLVVLPLVTMYLPLLSNLDHPVRVGMVDQDNTAFTAQLTDDLKTKAELKVLTDDNVQQQLIDQQVDYAIRLDKGFTDRLIQGGEAKIQGYSLQESNMSLPIKTYLDGYLSAAASVAQASGKDAQAFAKGMELFRTSSLQMKFDVLGENNRDQSYSVIGIFVLFMMYSAAFSALMILTDKQKQTLHRTLAAPISVRSYMLQTILAFLVVSVLQVAVLLAILRYGFRIYLGTSIPALFLLLCVFSLVAVSFGVLLSSLARSVMQALLVGVSIIVPCGMLGGLYWPIDRNPELVQKVAWFDPVTWVMKGVHDLLYDGTLAALVSKLGIMFLFAAMFFLLGTMRKTDVQK